MYRRRIASAERAARRQTAAPCGECGHRDGAPVEYDVTIDYDGSGPQETTRCSACGWPTGVVVSIDYSDGGGA